MLNAEVFQKVQHAHKKILVVTKYWNTEITQQILQECESNFGDIFLALGENRIEHIVQKNIPREKLHFIGNIQSRKIEEIVQYCSCIHSLENLKHAQKIEAQGIYIEAFIQIKLDENKDIGISQGEFPTFLETCKNFKNLKIIGIAGMGNGDFSLQEKRDEFQKLISLRDTYISNGLISAGTSRDYEIALEEGIDIVRVGEKTIET